MGQKIVKQIKLPSSISKAINSYDSRMAQDAIDDISRKQSLARAAGLKYSDPNAMEGFKRDTWGDEGLFSQKEKKQIKVTSDEGHQEMPEDLLNFLKEAGPLEKKLSKSMTSPKVYESLLKEEEEKKQKQKEAQLRTRRKMRIVEQNDLNSAGEDELEKEGMTTIRTTSYSTKPREEKGLDSKLDDVEIFQFLEEVRGQKISPEAYLKKKYSNMSHITEDEMQKTLTLLQNVSTYNGNPILMQDDDKSMVGAWNHRTENLQRQKVRFTNNNARLVLEGENIIKGEAKS